MKEQGFGCSSWSLIRKCALTIVCFAFVDNTDLIHVQHDQSTPTHQVLAQAQWALSLWEQLIHATGGALAPEKSYWYLVEVKRTNRKWSCVRKNQQPYDLILQEGRTSIDRLEVYQAKKTLEIMIRPDGKMTDEVKYLKGKVYEWCDGICTKRLHPNESWHCVNSTIIKTLQYLLTATTLTEQQCKEIIRPILKTALALCNAQSNLPRALVHGTLHSRGLNIPNLYWTQLIYHVQLILWHMHRDTPFLRPT
jgi:hypothetical protein